MDGTASIYTEKKLAYYEASYKTSVIAKPQEVNLTLTAAHIYGVGYVCQQTGTVEQDPIYTRFSCGLDEITKVYINENVKSSPLYIQCDFPSKGVVNRKRIIIPCLDHVSKIVESILDAKKELDQKIESKKKIEYDQKLKKIESEKALDKIKYPEKEDPVNQLNDFFNDLDNKDNNNEETPSVKEVNEEDKSEVVEEKVIENPKEKTLPPITNPFDNEEKVEKKDFAESLITEKPKSSTIQKTNPIKEVVNKAQNAAKAAVKAANSIDVDDVISEILDNLQAKVGFGNNEDPEESYKELETPDTNDTENDNVSTEKAEEIEATAPVNLDNLSFDDYTTKNTPVEEVAEDVTEVQQEAEIEDNNQETVTEDSNSNNTHDEMLSYTPKETIKLEEFEASVRQLKNLLDNNVITEDKFISEKKKLIAKLY